MFVLFVCVCLYVLFVCVRKCVCVWMCTQNRHLKGKLLDLGHWAWPVEPAAAGSSPIRGHGSSQMKLLNRARIAEARPMGRSPCGKLDQWQSRDNGRPCQEGGGRLCVEGGGVRGGNIGLEKVPLSAVLRRPSLNLSYLVLWKLWRAVLSSRNANDNPVRWFDVVKWCFKLSFISLRKRKRSE